MSTAQNSTGSRFQRAGATQIRSIGRSLRTPCQFLWAASSLVASLTEISLVLQLAQGTNLGATSTFGLPTIALLVGSFSVCLATGITLGIIWLRDNAAYYQCSAEGALCFVAAIACWHVTTMFLGLTLVLGVQAMSFSLVALLFAIPSFALLKAFAGKGHEAMDLARRWMARPAEDVLQLDNRPPVVFLRSFRSENCLKPSGGPKVYREGLMGALLWTLLRPITFEERLCSQLNQLGPVIAIGQPQDSLPRLGAARTYVRASMGDDEAWQSKVIFWLDHCRAVCMLVGSTQGLHWEFDQAIRTLPPTRIILIIPPLEDALEGTRIFLERAGVPSDATTSEIFSTEESADVMLGGGTIRFRRKPVAVTFSDAWKPTVIVGDYDDITYDRIVQQTRETSQPIA